MLVLLILHVGLSGYTLAEVYIICIAVDTFLSMLSISRAHVLALSLLSV